MRSTITFPFSIGDRVRVFGEDGWIVVGLCYSDRGVLFMVENEEGPKVVNAEALEVDA